MYKVFHVAETLQVAKRKKVRFSVGIHDINTTKTNYTLDHGLLKFT